MRNLIAWKIAALLTISVWLLSSFISIKTLPAWQEGELFVALPASSLDAATAFEMELATLFAQQLKVKLKPFHLSNEQLENALLSHKVHMVAAGMRSNGQTHLRFSSSYQTLNEQVICAPPLPQKLADLSRRKLTVAADSAQEYALRSAAEHIPNLHWDKVSSLSTSTLLQEVAEGRLDCTVANQEQLVLARNFYPQLGDALDLNSASNLAWAFTADVDPKLYDAAQQFLARIRKDGTLSRIIDRHYGHNERLETLDAVAFVTKARTLLPHYQIWFEEAATLTGIEWHLIAALAYQESHWDPFATSYTNVRGMMMLTEDTADRMNLPNRLDAHDSIIAGAKYLQLLKESLPTRINDKERTWMALAAYNQGMGHLEDARVLAAKAGLNPDVWSDVRKVMPLLSRPAYFEQTKHGQARGGEAVILVETVRLYHDMLNRLEQKESMHLPPNLALLLQHRRKFSSQ